MRLFLPLLCALCITPVGSFYHGTCPKKEPPPGVLVLSPGSSLVLSCDGDVKVDGAKVKVSKQGSNNNAGEHSSSETQTTAYKPHRNEALIKADTNALKGKHEEQGVQAGREGRSSPVYQVFQPTSTPPKAEDMDTSKVTRGLKGKWKVNGKTVGRGHWDWGGFTVGSGGAQLSVSSTRPKDSGNYSCHHRGRERFSVKVIVAVRPDPPAAVSVRQEIGHETRITVNWTYPASWKSQDSYYELIYELKYHPVNSSHEQVKLIRGRRSSTITDALSGVEYMIQLRTQDEFDGLWSSWSAPVYGSSWTEVRTQEPVALYDDDLFPEYESSGTEDEPSEALPELSVSPAAVSHHILWISCPLALLAVVFVACVFRDKEKVLSKLHSLSVPGRRRSPAQPASPATIGAEGRALVTFSPPSSKEEEEAGGNEDERSEMARREAVHFNNTHYFLIQSH
ncbi:interleukin-6 receptor subunit alpha isoform X3 [Dunckerocampus dactyliophorus]|uniref:interleukin-6 receptor subunit alpha isoform X3 n=1 Tax=Dunckerocampus dactyliophorus TaxID=161453 RepID=UPI0024066426|nr:interleukin-6 receptor subunit alpha isoform X3 [Dunckerocampus dactyliophorus]